MKILLFRVLSFLVLICSMGATQNAGAQECRVTTTVRFLDKSGQPVSNLTADQVTAQIGNRPAKITSLQAASKPEIILLIDISTSMKDQWQQSLAAAKQMASLAGENITLVLFNTTIRGKVTGSANVQKALNDLTAYKAPGGATALYDSLLEVASDAKQGSAAIIVISEGGDNQSKHSLDQTITQLLSLSMPVFDFVIGHERKQQSFSQIVKIAEATGGFVITSSPSETNIAPTATRLMTDVLAPLTLVMQPQAPITHPEKLQIDVVDSNMKKQKDIHVMHGAQIGGCDKGQS